MSRGRARKGIERHQKCPSTFEMNVPCGCGWLLALRPLERRRTTKPTSRRIGRVAVGRIDLWTRSFSQLFIRTSHELCGYGKWRGGQRATTYSDIRQATLYFRIVASGSLRSASSPTTRQLEPMQRSTLFSRSAAKCSRSRSLLIAISLHKNAICQR